MENSATALANTLSTWMHVSNGQTVYVRREASSYRDYQFWRDQIAAAGLVDQVGRQLDALKAMGQQVGHYERAFPVWAAAVFAPEENWNQNSGDRVIIDQSSIDLLYSLGDYLRVTTPAVPIDATRRASVRDALNDVISLLTNGTVALGEAETRYLFELVNAVRTALDEVSTLGSLDLLRRIHELVGYLTTLADQLSESGVDETFVEKIREAARRVVPYTMLTAQAGFAILGAAADIAQITGH